LTSEDSRTPRSEIGGSFGVFEKISELGGLIPFEFDTFPFEPSRVFLVRGVPTGAVRGLHAHRECEQLMFALSGTVAVTMSDGVNSRKALLDSPTRGVYVPRMVWASQEYLCDDATLLVFASHRYSREDYVEDFGEFTSLMRAQGS
jgi:dTDP-4-dehydrorhamnose 3,5-epimerase-like enzyme